MVKRKTKAELTVTWRDFVPPVFFKLGRFLKSVLIEDGLEHGDLMSVQLVAFMMIMASFTLGVLTFALLPKAVADVTYALASNYSVSVTPQAQLKAAEVRELMQQTMELDYGRAVLGVTDVQGADELDNVFDITTPESVTPSVTSTPSESNEQKAPTSYNLMQNNTPLTAGFYYSYYY